MSGVVLCGCGDCCASFSEGMDVGGAVFCFVGFRLWISAFMCCGCSSVCGMTFSSMMNGIRHGFSSRFGVGLSRCVSAVVAGVFVAGCSAFPGGFVEGESEESDLSRNGVEDSDGVVSGGDVVMSGGYVVGADGKLVNPDAGKDIDFPYQPVAMLHNDQEGAEALARYFVETIHYVWHTQKTGPLKAISDVDCGFCQKVILEADDFKTKGGWMTGGEYELTDLSGAFEIPDHPGNWHKELLHVQKEVTYYDGERLYQTPPMKERMRIQMRFDEERGWLVTEADGELVEE